MSLRHFLIQIALALAVLLAANVAVRKLANNSIPRQLLRTVAASESATDLFFGNSTMAAGLDEAAFNLVRPGHRAANLALGASDPVEHLLIFRQKAKQNTTAMYYGFLDTQLTNDLEGGWNTLTGNRALGYYVEPDIAFDLYAPDQPAKAFALRLVGRVPILVERFLIWSKIEQLRRRLGAIGMPPQDVNRFGRAEDFKLLESDPADFERRCLDAVQHRTPLNPAIQAIIQRSREQGVQLQFVEMPMPLSHRQRFYASPAWKAYRSHLMEVIQQAGGSYITASDWVDDTGFADHLHLNADGARRFSERLGQFTPVPR